MTVSSPRAVRRALGASAIERGLEVLSDIEALPHARMLTELLAT